MKKIIILCLLIYAHFAVFAQKKNVNAAWRALTDYQSTLNDKPNIQYLHKAKENIDIAIQNPETKEDAKALTYRSQIYYELFKYYQNNPDNSINYYNYLSIAIEAFQVLNDKYPKIATTTEIQNHGIFLLNTSNQEAVKLFNSQKYTDASRFFSYHYVLQKKIFGTVDTSGIFNAFVSAYKASLSDRIESLSQEMIQNNIDNVKVYQLLYNYYQNKNDTANALKILNKGRAKYEKDQILLNLETDHYIRSKQYEKAINNLEYIIRQDTNNALLLLSLGNLYDNLANQKMNAKNYSDSTDKLFQNAINNYMKSYRYKEKLDRENLFTLTYNIGAYYTNYGTFYYNRKMKEFKIIDLSQKQKEVEDKRKEYTKLALPYLKEAESINPDDKTVITALYKVYAMIGDTKNAELYKNKILQK